VNNLCAFVSAMVEDDPGTGQIKGRISAVIYDNSSYQPYISVHCEGPAYAGMITINTGTGESTLNATVDPNDPAFTSYCYQFGTNQPVTISLRGTYSPGSFRQSESRPGTTTISGATTKYTQSVDGFGEAFNGTIAGYSVTIHGGATYIRGNNVTK
jgi:hypothetical protein